MTSVPGWEGSKENCYEPQVVVSRLDMIMQENLPDRGHYKCKGPDVDHPWSTWKAWLEHREHGTDESKMTSAGMGGVRFYSTCDWRTGAKECQLRGFRI